MFIDDEFARRFHGDAGRGPAGMRQRVRAASAACTGSRSADQSDDHAAKSAERVLRGLDPAGTEPDLGLAQIAVVYASSSLEGCDDAMKVAWARYARATRESLCGPVHPFTVGAALVLAEAYERCAVRAVSAGGRVALYEHAAAAYRSLIALYERLVMPRDAERARIRLAVCRHAAGGCGEAIRLAEMCWQTWMRTPRRLPPDGCSFAARYAAMLQACGRQTEAVAVAQQARSLLPAGHMPGAMPFTLAFEDVSRRPHEAVCAARLTWDQSW
ncbi:hypothetical protein ACTOB_003758 [Actinoplanes oblitus]|uniref:Transcriptional regulator n=1 Tax=Actinoplanes oblitus TaxID=3040509 RepID=A0ABY8WQ99_9ACTN|nr:hypothetical protein [Actinoplanes oblitus]WIN00077.1 hypothetical protein ACTOB_003758 [Actinoplanes oblitus]